MKWWKRLIIIVIYFLCICAVLKLIDPYVDTKTKIIFEQQDSEDIAIKLKWLYLNLMLSENKTPGNSIIQKGDDILKDYKYIVKNSRRFFYYIDSDNKNIPSGQLIVLALGSNPQNKSFGLTFGSEPEIVFLNQDMLDKMDFKKYKEIIVEKQEQ
ncbi:MAG: hypothetical protein HY761_05340 [Candidatus Omnitrophica bacterium]|nr:hypothetical protein [Candidatus Omnitrophota bacterium]